MKNKLYTTFMKIINKVFKTNQVKSTIQDTEEVELFNSKLKELAEKYKQ